MTPTTETMKPTTETIITEIFRAVGQQFGVDLKLQIVPHPKCQRLVFEDLGEMSISYKKIKIVQDAIEACLCEFGFCCEEYRDANYNTKWYKWIWAGEIAIYDVSVPDGEPEQYIVSADEIQAKIKQTLLEFVEAQKQLYRTQYQLMAAKVRELEDEQMELVDILSTL